jgi:hypothetical protein
MILQWDFSRHHIVCLLLLFLPLLLDVYLF